MSILAVVRRTYTIVTLSPPHLLLKMKISSESSTRGSSTSNSSSGCESEMEPKLKQGSRLLFNKEDNDDYLTEVEEAGESKNKRDLMVFTFQRRMHRRIQLKNL